jgi:hypothetical protein
MDETSFLVRLGEDEDEVLRKLDAISKAVLERLL